MSHETYIKLSNTPLTNCSNVVEPLNDPLADLISVINDKLIDIVTTKNISKKWHKSLSMDHC